MGRRSASFAALVVAMTAAVGPGRGDARSPIPLGTSVWWACTQPAARYAGPAQLACRRPYTPRYARILRTFDVISPENEFKFPYIHPGATRHDFTVADQIAAYAQRHGQKVRGHALIWGKDTPGWMAGWSHERTVSNRLMLLAVMKKHITTVMTHFRERFPGVVTQWDVVNEALEDTGGPNRNLFSIVLGQYYVEAAFRFARAADPRALLFYNEYGAERPGPRRQATLDMAADFKRRGVPLDGIGLQMHVGTGGNYPSHAQLRGLMQKYARLGLRVEITEMDVGITPTPRGLNPTREQAKVYRSVFEDCRAAPNCTGITVRGVADPYSWRGRAEHPLLYDDGLTAKPFVADLRRLLR